ncbi:MAG: ARPP-1 family domain-containing protein, partial [Actinomycetota bacterium]
MTIIAIKEATIGKPKTRLGTTLYPIFIPNNSPKNIKIATDDLVVSELESASVPQIQVHNPTKNPLLIPAGKVLSGGRQTRTVNVSILVAPGSTIVIPVSCVEAGRWHGQHRFEDSRRFASRRVRMEKQRSVARNVKNLRNKMSDQGAVWNSIDSELISRHRASKTKNFLYAEESLNDEKERFSVVQELLNEGPEPQQNGIAIAQGDKVVSVEMFASPDALKTSYEALIRSAIFDSPEKKVKAP